MSATVRRTLADFASAIVFGLVFAFTGWVAHRDALWIGVGAAIGFFALKFVTGPVLQPSRTWLMGRPLLTQISVGAVLLAFVIWVVSLGWR
ncbi:MAG: hypothetical protein JSS00_12845 [Proteobacteria bacterium]|nr:hypothetical protein [Pseudomonadota bacterium]